MWHRRYCALVPHTFLYYFGKGDLSSPKGVIDLELYSNIEAWDSADGGTIELKSDSDAQLRHFYFRADVSVVGICENLGVCLENDNSALGVADNEYLSWHKTECRGGCWVGTEHV